MHEERELENQRENQRKRSNTDPACRSASSTFLKRMDEGVIERGPWALAPPRSREETETAIWTPVTTHQDTTI